MADGKARNAYRAALGSLLVFAVWLLGTWPPPFWWRDHWPRHTAMMLRTQARYGGSLEPYRAVPLPDISPNLRRTVIVAEDWRFYAHGGIDFAEIRDAAGVPRDAGAGRTLAAIWRQRDRVRGASTITQQLAKNLYLSPSRSALRKLKEAVIAVRLDRALSKDRVLELYLNVAEWGPDIWGVDRASREYFGAEPAALTLWQAASLAATLPHPRTSNPVYHPARMAARRELILARYHGRDVVIPPSELVAELPEIKIDPPPVFVPPVLESLFVDSIVIRDTVTR